MASVTVNPPKTPVTKGSSGIAAATVPNVCKMPGPPAPFVPTPLPNIGKSGDSPDGYSTSVTIEGDAVAIQGASFKSMGDVASQGTGGGIVSNNTQGATKFVAPGSMDVKIEGKNVQYLGDQMSNNNGPSGSPPNAATLAGVIQMTGMVSYVQAGNCPLCGKDHPELAETNATKADASSLIAAIRREGLPLMKMLGVVHCKHKEKYADHSGVTFREVAHIARDAGFHTRPGLHPSIHGNQRGPRRTNDEVRDRYMRNVSGEFHRAFRRGWSRAWTRYHESRDPFLATGDTHYQPGQCAGQKVILLAVDSGARPMAMTEKWYHHEGRPTAGRNRHLRRFRGGGEFYFTRRFEHGSSVPPCGTCAIILPLLLCPGSKDPLECTGHTPPRG